MKFGGTSVADSDAIERLIAIVRQQTAAAGASGAPVVVVSALARVTDALVDVARLAEEGEGERAASALRAIVDRHVAVATAVTAGGRARVLDEVRREFDELVGLVHGLAVLREVSPRSRCAVLRRREVVTTPIVAPPPHDPGVQA